jgi:DivIVA domain-containing protein
VEAIERIRNATFTMVRRGYDRREVDGYLAKLADWLERRGADIDDYAKRTRKEADAYASKVRAEADAEAAEKVKQAEAKAIRMVEEGAKRRREMERVIADLQSRREAVVKGLEKLSSQLAGTATEAKSDDHRAAQPRPAGRPPAPSRQ